MIAIGSDHAGYDAKEELKLYFGSEVSYKDFGTINKDSCDYPLIAEAVARAVSNGECTKGILICGSGIGMSIAANKIKNIRAAVCNNTNAVKLARSHNDINVLCMGARIISVSEMEEIIEVFLSTPFEEGEYNIWKLKTMYLS